MKKEEKYFLFKKLTKNGLSEDEVGNRIRRIEDFLKKLVSKLRKQRMSERDIDIRFKKEFAKICENV